MNRSFNLVLSRKQFLMILCVLKFAVDFVGDFSSKKAYTSNPKELIDLYNYLFSQFEWVYIRCYVDMEQVIKIIVTTPDRNNTGSFKEVFWHSISVDDSIDFDYKSLLKGI